MKKQITNLIFFIVLLMSGGLFFVSKQNPIGIRSFTVLSGSMEPAILTGSIILTRSKSEYNKGDIITFSQNGQIVTHRIINVTYTKTGNQYTTKGDANNVLDRESISNNSVIGKEIFYLPFIGYISSFLKTLPGLVIFIVLPAVIMIVFEVLSIKSELKKGRDRVNLT